MAKGPLHLVFIVKDDIRNIVVIFSLILVERRTKDANQTNSSENESLKGTTTTLYYITKDEVKETTRKQVKNTQ